MKNVSMRWEYGAWYVAEVLIKAHREGMIKEVTFEKSPEWVKE